jgi:peptide/nickel transport system ATP-binding protein
MAASDPPAAAGAEPATILSVRDLTVGYAVERSWTTPIAHLDLDLRAGEVVGLVGDAGSGKSTLALALLGLARPPGKILSGSVAFDGRDILTLPAEQRRLRGEEIAIIVQNPRAALNPMLRIGRQIGFAYQAHRKASDREARARAIEMLRLVGINDPERRVDAYAHELSGGMAQRALIAMALAARPRVLIADEPTSGLDVTIQAQFLDEMWQTVRQTGSTTLLVTKELGIIANYCDRVLVLHDGRIVEAAPVRQFFSSPAHAYSQAILALERGESTGSAAARATAIATDRPLVAVKGLTVHFPVRGTDKVVRAVEDVDFTISPGETLGLVGESGSGKTTVGRALLRLLKPTAGSVAFEGQDLTGLSDAALRRFRSRMQVVFQDPFDSVNPRWTTRAILEEPLKLHTALDASGRLQRSRELMDMVGLDPALLDRKPQGLGAGAMQRLAIARALATEPAFVVLDEPTSVLSPRALVGLTALLQRLQRDLGLSYLFISHDLTSVRHLSHRVAIMYLGQIVEMGSVEEIFATPLHPYARALLAAHLEPDPTRRRVDRPPAERLEGEIPSPIDLPPGCHLAGRCPHAVDRCRREPQHLVDRGGGRAVRCWRVVAGEIAAGTEG